MEMIKKLFNPLLISLMTIACGQPETTANGSGNDSQASRISVNYSANDLEKIKWIEGKWKGTYKTKPFYEIYHFPNDTTLEIISYEWNGKDSSKTSKSSVYWKDGAFYLGNELNWKVTEITDSSIFMIPNNKASNEILWKYHDGTSWDAILNSQKETTEYHMQAYDPFSK
jgi:hypothetical protein